MKKYLNNLSKISIHHYIKIFIRGAIFLTALILLITGKIDEVSKAKILPAIVWVWYFIEMVIRLLIPTSLESMGCQKVFKCNYQPPEVKREPKNQPAKVTFLVAMIWFALNGAIFGVHFLFPQELRPYILGIVAMAYGVCDIICILFFCPFQTWFMKNRCCTTCRIYNWDFAMLFTPFVFIPSFYTYSLLGMALLILARWEITYKLHPERFSERTNEALRCKNCTEKLCKHKVQLQGYIKKHKDILFEKLEPVVEKLEPAIEKIESTAEAIKETIAPIKDGIEETYEKAKEKTVEAYEKVKDKTVETYEKVKEKTAETISLVVDKTVETYEKVKDKTVETYEKVKDKTKEILGIETEEKDLEVPMEELVFEGEETLNSEKAESLVESPVSENTEETDPEEASKTAEPTYSENTEESLK